MNKPVAWMDYLEHSDVYDLNVSGRGIPLYTHPHPDNLGLAESIIKQQQAEIDSLKDKLMLAKQSLEIVEGWTKNEYEPPDFFFVEHDLMGKR